MKTEKFQMKIIVNSKGHNLFCCSYNTIETINYLIK